MFSVLKPNVTIEKPRAGATDGAGGGAGAGAGAGGGGGGGAGASVESSCSRPNDASDTENSIGS